MQIMSLGIDRATGAPLAPPRGEDEFARFVTARLGGANQRALTRAGGPAEQVRSQRPRVPDAGDPLAEGWAFLVNGDDPRRGAAARALRPLAELRGMGPGDQPLVFSAGSIDDWADWVTETYLAIEARRRPHYVLIVGGPDQVPFLFQALLGSAASVGRLDFDAIGDLEAYVAKVVRLERERAAPARREALVFAPDGGPEDATCYSRRYLAEPVAAQLAGGLMPAHALLADQATAGALREACLARRPALVFAASHGLADPLADLATQRRLNGAICGQRPAGAPLDACLFTAADVPLDEPFLEGAVMFQVACFSYGTPAESEYTHWVYAPERNAAADFVAALPRRLLAHPRGPVACVGHLDAAFVHGFGQPDSPELRERWLARRQPFTAAVAELCAGRPAGYALRELAQRYNTLNAQLTSRYDRLQRGRLASTPSLELWFAQTFISRSDAQNYMVLGDPAARLCVATP